MDSSWRREEYILGGLDETLTVIELGFQRHPLSPCHGTNIIENALSFAEDARVDKEMEKWHYGS